MNLENMKEEDLVLLMDNIHEELVSRSVKGKEEGSLDWHGAKSRATIMCYPKWARELITKNVFSPLN